MRNNLYIPASTIKVLTSLIALDHWGNDYRFKTDFYFDPVTNSLWVKGYGDPYLVSEELDIIVNKIKQEGISELDGIVLIIATLVRPLVLMDKVIH